MQDIQKTIHDANSSNQILNGQFNSPNSNTTPTFYFFFPVQIIHNHN